MNLTAKIRLPEGPNVSTRMAWPAEVTMSGAITSFASRLMGIVSKRLTPNLFEGAKMELKV